MKKGKIIILSAPSGCGKSTIIAEVIKDTALKLEFSISATNREPRRGETDGVNYYFLSTEDFKKAIANFKWIDKVLGSPEKTVLECEQIPRREARRSLVLTRDMKAGEIINKEDLMPKRPGTGISPVYADIVIGRSVKSDLAEDTILTWEMV